MEVDGKLIGQALYIKSELRTDTGKVEVLTLGPISILPNFQRVGYGLALLQDTMKSAVAMGYGAVLLEGNPAFYSLCGFKPASDFGIRLYGCQDNAMSPCFLCKELQHGFPDGISGEYVVPIGYLIEEEEAEKYDKAFPAKVKLKLPGQLW